MATKSAPFEDPIADQIVELFAKATRDAVDLVTGAIEAGATDRTGRDLVLINTALAYALMRAHTGLYMASAHNTAREKTVELGRLMFSLVGAVLVSPNPCEDFELMTNGLRGMVHATRTATTPFKPES